MEGTACIQRRESEMIWFVGLALKSVRDALEDGTSNKVSVEHFLIFIFSKEYEKKAEAGLTPAPIIVYHLTCAL